MRALTVADEVVPAVYSLSIKQRFPDVGLVLACGDLPYYYLEFIVTMLGRQCFFVYGNHDGPEETAEGEIVQAPRGCDPLDGYTAVHQGLLLAGLGGSLRYKPGAAHQYSEQEMALRVWRLAPLLLLNRLRYGRYLDILLTHAPPLHIHNGPDYPHRGFAAFLRLMERFTPRYLIHGHIHLSYGFGTTTRTRYRQTEVINTAGYQVLDLYQPGISRIET